MGRRKRTKQIYLPSWSQGDGDIHVAMRRNGSLVFYLLKDVDPQLFEKNRDTVVWWRFDRDNRIQAYEFILSAWFAGAERERLKIIAFTHWEMNDLDCLHWLHNHTGLKAERTGRLWKVYDDRLEIDPGSVTGKGTLLLLAVIDYREKSAKKDLERCVL